MPPARPSSVPRWMHLLGAVTLVCAAVITGFGLSGSPRAAGVGLLLSGVPPVMGGLFVVHRSRRADGRRETFRLLMGAAALCWGLGQVWLGLQSAMQGFAVDVPVPSGGDLLAACAAPLSVWGLALLPRADDRRYERLRMALDAVLIGAVGSIVVWELFFRERFGGAFATVDVGVVAFVVLDILVITIFATTALREADRGIGLATLGIAAQVTSDLVTLHGGDGQRPWVAALVTCVAWSVIGIGVATVVPASVRARRAFRPAEETRRLVVVSAVFLGLCGAVLVGLMLPAASDLTLRDEQVLLALALAFVVVLWVREVVRARQSRELLEQLSEQALTDPLTALGNRRALTDCLTGHGLTEVGLVAFDLDGFKDVNRILGHSSGDALLVRVGALVRQVLDHDEARGFRLGGDEFAVLVIGTEARTVEIAELLLAHMRTVGDDLSGIGRVALSASFGISHLAVPDDAREDDRVAALLGLLDLSGEAMRESKTSGRDQLTVYGEQTATRATRRAAVERRLRQVVASGGVDVLFQPVIDIASGRVVGVEGLARWSDPELGDVPPLEFVGVAEDVGLMPELGLRILERALSQFVASGAPARGATIGLNVSTLQLRTPGYAALVTSRVHAAGLSTGNVVIEVTESVLLNDSDLATDAVYELAAAGHPIALDDFGTGFSSLAYLHQLPVAVLKIDRTMVLSLDTDRGQAIARGVVQMGQALGLDIVAEGVETPVQAGYVRAMGIPYVQGWLYARAMPAAELRAYVEEHGTLAELAAQTSASATRAPA